MDLNLTDTMYHHEEVTGPDESEAQVLFESLSDISRVDEAAALICSYEPNRVIVDISDEYFELLREELDGIELILGAEYECP